MQNENYVCLVRLQSLKLQSDKTISRSLIERLLLLYEHNAASNISSIFHIRIKTFSHDQDGEMEVADKQFKLFY